LVPNNKAFEEPTTDMSSMMKNVKKKTQTDIINEIFSREWKRKAFKFVIVADRYVSGYELAKEFKVSPGTAYGFIKRMVEFGVFEYSPDWDKKRTPDRRVKVTQYGKKICDEIEPLLRLQIVLF